jgi:hypothetical protein
MMHVDEINKMRVAWRKGYFAQENKNPYMPGTREHGDWIDGYQKQQDEQNEHQTDLFP